MLAPIIKLEIMCSLAFYREIGGVRRADMWASHRSDPMGPFPWENLNPSLDGNELFSRPAGTMR